MSPNALKFFRSIQVYFPFLQDYKFTVQRHLRTMMNKTHEADFELLPYFPRKNNLFVDIGANRGDAIHSVLMRVPEAKVVAFEPNSFLTTKLNALYGNNRHVEVINSGLGNASSSFELFIPFYNHYMFDGLASFKEQNARDWLTNRLYNFDKNKLEIKKMQCQVHRLDEYNLAPDFIKIDVQGFEYEVLLGAERTIVESRPVILMEAPKDNELRFMTRLGYDAFYYKDRMLQAGSKYYNVFFLPGELVPEISLRVPMRFNTPIAA